MMSIIRNPLPWLVLLALLTGCSGKSEKETKTDDKSQVKSGDKSDPGKKNGSDEPVIRMTSKAYAEEFKQDKEATVKKYQDKTLELTGLVTRAEYGFTHDGKSPPRLALEGVKDSNNYGRVHCETVKAEPWKEATPGQTVKLRGKVPDLKGIPLLQNCEIIETSGPRPPALTADQLSQEYAADAKATNAKYDGKFLLLSGEIDRSEKEKSFESTTFKTMQPEPTIFVTFDYAPKEKKPALEKGQKVVILAKYKERSLDKDVHLDSALLWEVKP